MNTIDSPINRQRISWIVALCCLVKLGLHLLADAHSGFQGDEFLHIETGHHLSAGYMEVPPLIGWIAFLQDLTGSASVFLHHTFVHLAALLIMVCLAMLVVELGGGERAVWIAMLSILIAPAFGRSQQLFQPTIFSQLFWLVSSYQLLRFVKTLEHRHLFGLSLALGFGFLAKYDILLFIPGLLGLFLFRRTRAAMLQPATILCIVLFMAVVGPNITWQVLHGWPVFQHMARLYATQLDHVTVGGVLHDLVLHLHPLNAFLWIGGLFFLLFGKNKPAPQPLGMAVLCSLVLLVLARSKAYYFFPVMLTLLAAGSVWLEQRVLAVRAWLIYPLSALLIASGVFLMPYSMPVLTLSSYIRFAHVNEENGRYPIPFAEFYSRQWWSATLDSLQQVYIRLPDNEKTDCLVWGKHYSQAGAVNLFGDRYQLPHAFSYHGSFYLWAPTGKMPSTVIAFSYSDAGIDFFRNYFEEVTQVSAIFNPYAKEENEAWQYIYLCRRPRQDFEGLKELFRERVFE